MGLVLKTQKALRMSSFRGATSAIGSGISGGFSLSGMSRCQMNAEDGFGRGQKLGLGFQCRAIFILLVPKRVVHCHRIFRSLYVSSSFMFWSTSCIGCFG